MQRLHRAIAYALIAASPAAHAQLYGTSDVSASTTSNTNETQPGENAYTYRLGALLLRDSFE